MGTFLESIIARAKQDMKTIVLPEGNDVRTLEAAEKVAADKVANLIVLGNPDEIAQSGFALDGVEVVDPATYEKRDELAQAIYEARKHKGMTPEEALAKLDDPLYFGVAMVKCGMADGMVSGACHATADVLRPSLQILKTAPGSKLVS